MIWLVKFGGWNGAAMIFVALAVFWHYYIVSKKEFGGISGDLAGWFLQRAEIWMLAALVICQLWRQNYDFCDWTAI